MDFNEQLIELVRGYPQLYDSKNVGYKDRIAKDNAWRCISQATGQTEEICFKRWRYLRDKYKKVKNELTKKSGDAASVVNMWSYFESLRFLDDHLRHKITASSIVTLTPIDTISDSNTPQTEIHIVPEVAEDSSLEEDVFLEPTNDITPPSRSSSEDGSQSTQAFQSYQAASVTPKSSYFTNAQKRKSTSKVDLQENILRMMEKNCDAIASRTNTTDDEFDLFGKLIARKLRRMDPQSSDKAMETILTQCRGPDR